MSTFFYASIFVLFFLGSLARADNFCIELFEKPLSETYNPFIQTERSPAPSWDYAKALLRETIPYEEQKSLDTLYQDIDQTKGGRKYSTFATNLMKDPDLRERWALKRRMNDEYHETVFDDVTERVFDNDFLIYVWTVKETKLTKDNLKAAYAQVMKNNVVRSRMDIVDPNFRSIHVTAGGEFIYPRHQDVDRALDDLVSWYESKKNRLHPIQLAGMTYLHILSLQPFKNGNKRLARWVADWILISHELPPLTGSTDWWRIGTGVYGNVAYSENRRTWNFLSDFADFVRRSVKAMVADMQDTKNQK